MPTGYWSVSGGRLKAVVAYAVIAFVLLMTLGVFPPPREAEAQPSLAVSKSFSGKPLLGGTATVSITVTNTGSQRGYNLSVTDVFSSSRPDPEGRVTFVSASDSNGNLPPTSVSSDPATGDLTVSFENFRDLEPTESATIEITVSLAGDATWEVGDLLADDVTARVNDLPDGSGAWRQGTASASTEVIPITIVTKSANQSTGVGQATGTLDWPYSYTIRVQNNYVGSSDNVVVTDTIPDGVEYLGVSSGPAPNSVVRDNASGVTVLTWNVGTLGASASWTVTYGAGIRYDYFGTANGGTNRPHDDFDGDPPLGAPVLDKTPFTNTADLAATWLGTPYTDSDTAQVTGCYATIEKSVSPTLVGNGTVVAYTVDYYTSEYYNIDGITITDVLPDGQTYNGDAVPAPDSVQGDTPGPGQTTLTWNTLPEPMASGEKRTITFTATVDYTWEAPPVAGEEIVADDSMSNDVTLDATWHDEPDPTRVSQTTSCASAAGVSTGLPSINKQVSLDGSGWTDAVQATVGDELWFRVRFNTADGASPIRSDIRFKDISVTDWLPPGTSYIAGSYALAYSTPAGSYFLSPGSQYDDPPTPVAIGGLKGLAWWLGNIERGGWWQVVFRARVDDVAAVSQGVTANDLGKLAGENTFGQRYSDRDGAEVAYVEPELTLTKTAVSVPSPLLPGSAVQYEIVIDNTGGAAAKDVLVTDALPVGMRLFDPTSGPTSVTLDGTPLAENADFVEAYDAGTGVATWDLQTATVSTAIPAGSRLVIAYASQVDPGVGAGAVLTDLATVSCNTQADGSGRAYPGSSNPADPQTDDETVSLAPVSIAKSYQPAGPFTIGDTVVFHLDVTVPRGMYAYWPEITDTLNTDGVEYVSGSAALTHLAGTPPAPAAFDPRTDPDPIVDTGPSPGTSLTWYFNNFIDNSGQPTDYVFRLSFAMRVTGLADGGSWLWWPPTASDTFTDRARVSWNTVNTPERQTDRDADSNTVTVDVDQPYLVLDKTNSGGPVSGGDTVDYTVSVSNDGWWTAYDNVVADTLPVGMRATDPSPTVAVTLDGSPLTEGTHYSLSYNGASGELTVDLEGGTSPTDIPAGSVLAITYTATVDGDVGSGSVLTNVASVSYNSRTDGAGRQVDRTSDPADPNTDDSNVEVDPVTIAKAVEGPNPATTGDEVTYVLTVTVPAETAAYWPEIRDVIYADGMEFVDGSASLSDVSGNPLAPASFRGGSSEPDEDYGTPVPGATFTWLLDTVVNAGSGATGDAPYVFQLRFRARVTGLADDGTTWLWWPPTANDRAEDEGTIRWSTTDQGPGTTDRSGASGRKTTDVDQPYLVLTKDLMSAGPFKGGDAVNYRTRVDNNGWWPSRCNVLVDTFPVGMRGTAPTITSITINGVPLSAGTNYTTSWNPGTGQLTVDLTAGGATDTPIPAGQRLEINYTARVDGNIGAGSTNLANIASIAYNSRSDGAGRQVDRTANPADPNTDDASINIANCATSKSIAGPNPATIGDEVEYRIRVTVPAETVAYWPDIRDTLNTNGVDYVPGSASLVLISGSPETPAAFRSTSEPVMTDTAGGATLDWYLNTIDNASPAPGVGDTDYVFELRFRCTITGLADDDTTWLWWPPTAGDTTTDRGRFRWNTTDQGAGTVNRTLNTSTSVTNIDQPYLVLTKSNDAAGPLTGGASVNYTVTVVNSGWWTSYRNVFVDTLPEHMRENPPAVNLVSRNGIPLTPGVNYVTSWNAGTGELTVDLLNGSTPDTVLPVGQSLVIEYTATIDSDVPSGITLTNVASIAYNSRSDGAGRQVDRTSDPADPNTDDSSVSIELAGLTKTCDAPGNQATIGQAYDYAVTTTVAPYTVIYNAAITDAVADGLEVDAVSTELDGVPTPIGSVSTVYNPATGITDVTWDIGDYTNATASPQALSLVISVHVKDAYHDATPVNGLPPGQDNFSNTADLRWEDAETGGNTYTDSASAPDVTAVEPRLTIDKSWQNLTHPGLQPEAGDVLLYTVQVDNTGTSAAYGVSVEDTVNAAMQYVAGSIAGPGADDSAAPELQWDIGTIGAGSGATLTFRAEVKGGVYWGTDLTNTADLNLYYSLPQPSTYPARSYGPDSDTAPATARAAGLVVDKQATGDVWVQPGDTVSYRVTVTNVGDAVAYSANVTDTLPPFFAYVTGSTAATWSDGGSSSADPAGAPGPNLNWNLGALGAHINPGEQLVLDFQAVVQPGAALGVNTNTAYGLSEDGAGIPTHKASGIPADTDPLDEHSADLNVTNPEITVTKTLDDPDGFVPVGTTFSYTIRVENTGDTVIVSPVSLVDQYDPAYLEFVSSFPPPDAGSGGGLLTWSDVNFGSPILPGDYIDVTVNFTALRTGSTPDTDDSVAVTGLDEHGDPVGDTDTNDGLTITDPGITVTKTLDHPGGIVPVGDSFSYTIRVENTGGTTLVAPVSLVDMYNSAYLQFDSATPAPDAGSGGGLITWSDLTAGAALPPGGYVEVTVNFTALQAGQTPQTDDYANAMASDEHGDSVSDSDTDTSLVITGPGITVTKTLNDADGFVPVGGNMSYTVRVENTGDTTVVAPVHLTDLYDPYYYEFDYALPSEDTGGGGIVYWSDITAGAGLSPGEYVEVSVNFVALHPGTAPDTDDLAAATAEDENGDPVAGADVDDSLTVTNPEVTVDKRLAPGQDQYVRVGDPVSYEITITNSGDTAIDVLPLEDVFDDTHLAFTGADPAEDAVAGNVVTWNDLTAVFGDLAPGDSVSVIVNFTATNLGLDVIDVAAVGGAVDEHGDYVPLASDDDGTLGITEPDISVAKALDDADGFVPVGEVFSYTIRVENTGDTVIKAPVEMVDLYEPDLMEFVSASPAADPASGGGAALWPDLTSGADLAPGEYIEVRVRFRALRPGTTPDTDDLVMAHAEDEHGDPVSDGDVDANLTITDPRLSLDKSLASGQPYAFKVGDAVTFVITITNSGDTLMDVVPLADEFPAASLAFVSASVPPDAQGPGLLSWNDLTAALGDLAPGDSFQVTLTFRALSPADAALDRAVTEGAVDEHGDSPPASEDEASVRVQPNPNGVLITKVSDPPNYSPVVPGQVVTYTITCENVMEVPAENVVIEDYVDTTSEFLPGSIRLDGASLPDSHYDPATRLVTVVAGTLRPGEKAVLAFQVTVNEYDQARPEVTNVAQVTTDQTPPTASFPTIVLPVDPFEFHKAVQDLNGGSVASGDVLLWTITVKNVGSIPTTNVVVYDDVPAHTTYVPGSITGQGADDSDPARMRWNVGSIDVGVTVTLTFQSRVNPGLPAGTQIRNQAVMDADQLAAPKLSAPEGMETAGPNILPVTGADLYLLWLLAAGLVVAGALLALFGAGTRRRRGT